MESTHKMIRSNSDKHCGEKHYRSEDEQPIKSEESQTIESEDEQTIERHNRIGLDKEGNKRYIDPVCTLSNFITVLSDIYRDHGDMPILCEDTCSSIKSLGCDELYGYPVAIEVLNVSCVDFDSLFVSRKKKHKNTEKAVCITMV